MVATDTNFSSVPLLPVEALVPLEAFLRELPGPDIVRHGGELPSPQFLPHDGGAEEGAHQHR